MKLSTFSISIMLAVGLLACGGKAKGSEAAGGDADKPSKTLYDRLGGRDAIAAVVKDFVEKRVAKDKRIKAYFKDTDADDIEGKLVDQICEASGGPCKYTGKDMKTVHANMQITDDDFNALVEDLKASLDHFQVPAREQKELIGLLAPMHDAIVTAK